MDDYGDGLRALLFILEQSEHSNWTDNIRRDLEIWERKGISQTYLGNFGGMGSFNDFYPRFKAIPERKNSLYFQYFQDLQSYTFYLAKKVKAKEDDIEKMFDIAGIPMHASYCEDCEEKLVLLDMVWDFTGKIQARRDMKKYSKDVKLREIVEKNLNDDVSRLEKLQEHLLEMVKSNGLIIIKEKQIKKCPKCSSENIGRLLLNSDQDLSKLEPYHLSTVDLPDRIKAAFK